MTIHQAACGVVPVLSAPAVVTLSGEVISAFSFGSNADAELRINTNGNVYRRLNLGAWTQIDTATDWIIPEAAAPGAYQTRFTSLSGDSLFSSSSSEDNWLAISLGNWEARQRDANPAPGGEFSTFTQQIREGTGSVLDSGSYSLNAEREDF